MAANGEWGYTPLHLAVSHDRRDIAEFPGDPGPGPALSGRPDAPEAEGRQLPRRRIADEETDIHRPRGP